GAGGKAGAPVKSAALTPEQQEILAKRSVLSPEEIHKLASKTKAAMKATTSPAAPAEGVAESSKSGEVGMASKLSCHSDYVDPESAQTLQRERLVQVDVRPALGIGKEDLVI